MLGIVGTVRVRHCVGMPVGGGRHKRGSFQITQWGMEGNQYGRRVEKGEKGVVEHRWILGGYRWSDGDALRRKGMAEDERGTHDHEGKSE